jgi:hypothetical protein
MTSTTEPDSPALPITGGCLCRAVRFSIAAAPLTARSCWCRLCQYLAAGNATVNVVFPSAALSVTGATTDFASIADSGNHMHRRFCPTCGTAMFSASESRPNWVIVRAGTLDDPTLAPPQMTIWTAAAPTWACFDALLPQFPGPPPPAS